MEESKKPAQIVTQEDGAFVAVAGNSYRIVISGKQTGGSFAIIDMVVPPGGGPGPHAHSDFDESFYVLDGEIEVKTEVQTYMAKKGDFVHIPKGGIIHCFKNKSEQTARLWCTVVPAGLDAFFLEAGKPVQNGEFIAVSEPGEEEKKQLMALAEKYGQTLYPPDYLD
ncbi:MAG: cupin domain-containing protein [Dyadobacter sp.]